MIAALHPYYNGLLQRRLPQHLTSTTNPLSHKTQRLHQHVRAREVELQDQGRANSLGGT
jgi:hypothetical protein